LGGVVERVGAAEAILFNSICGGCDS